LRCERISFLGEIGKYLSNELGVENTARTPKKQIEEFEDNIGLISWYM
jgi:hypothetical protein